MNALTIAVWLILRNTYPIYWRCLINSTFMLVVLCTTTSLFNTIVTVFHLNNVLVGYLFWWSKSNISTIVDNLHTLLLNQQRIIINLFTQYMFIYDSRTVKRAEGCASSDDIYYIIYTCMMVLTHSFWIIFLEQFTFSHTILTIPANIFFPTQPRIY